MQVWLHSFAFAHKTAERARQAEGWGFHGMLVADSQNLNADVWVELALAGAGTERLHLGPGVTNPATRHPAVTASAAATLQAETGGRALLGLGRGDSALSQIGRHPVHVAELEKGLAEIQAYLSGEQTDADGFASRIAWLPEQGAPKVPVHVAATGPHVIAVGARQAEGIDFTVGAEMERLRWAVGTAREAAGDRKVSLGAYLNVAVDPDRASARDLVRGSTAIFARFATEGAPEDGLSEVTRAGIAFTDRARACSPPTRRTSSRPICAPPRRRSPWRKAERERGQIRAPISGVVSDVPVETGQALQMNAIVAEIIALDPMLAVVEVAERQLAGIKVGDRPTVRLVTGADRARARCASSRRPRARARAPTASTSSSTTPTARSPTASPPRSSSGSRRSTAVRVPRSALTFSAEGELSVRIVDADGIVASVPVADRRGCARRGLGRRPRRTARAIIVQGQDFVKDGQKVETGRGRRARRR